MSNPPSALSSSKATNNPPQLSPAQSQTGSSAGGDIYGQRRSGGTGNFASSKALPSPRNSQAARKQHKASKRPRLVDEDAIAESAAMRSTNSRKGQTSITHLMNFSLPPRPQHNRLHDHRHMRRNPTWGLGSGHHAVDKARYVHANYRFIVDPRGNYRPQSIDADLHLDWTNVLQILASAQSQAASCPICLGTPVAPRMAKCGHIFCLPCLIRYMHSEDGGQLPPEKRARWKKCPICYDSIYISETRPVRWYTGQEGEPLQEGHDVVLRLVMRAAGNTLALPRDGAEALSKEEDIPWHFAAEVMDYARIMKGSEEYIAAQYDRDIEELEKQEKEDEVMFGEDNVEWMRKAIRLLRESKEKFQGMGNPPSMVAKTIEPKPKRAPIVFTSTDAPHMYDIHNQSRSTVASSTNASVNDLSQETANGEPTVAPGTVSNISRLHQQQNSNCTPSEYYFYQALLHYYLSPLDIRILKAAFGAFSAFPSTILPRIEHISTGHIVDDDLRKRTKYLAHLPYGCEVAFLECDWTDTVAPDILARFAPEIARRRKTHQEKLTREEKSRLKAEKDESDRYRRANPSQHKRPSISHDRFSADDLAPPGAATTAGASTPLSIADDTAANTTADETSASASPPWPTRHGSAFASLASPSTSPSAARTVWGTAAIVPSSPPLQAPLGEQLDALDDGWLQGWERDLLAQEEDGVAQVQALSLSEMGGGGGGGGGGGKKGKKKKITLMSTNVRRGA